jgi:predicted dehydrogenase
LDWSVEIVGTQGRIFVPSPWKPNAQLASFILEVNGKAETVEIRDGGGIYHLEVDHFSRCVLENQPLGLPPEDGLRNMAVIDALQKSARTGRVAKVRRV